MEWKFICQEQAVESEDAAHLVRSRTEAMQLPHGVMVRVTVFRQGWFTVNRPTGVSTTFVPNAVLRNTGRNGLTVIEHKP